MEGKIIHNVKHLKSIGYKIVTLEKSEQNYIVKCDDLKCIIVAGENCRNLVERL